MKNKIVLLSFFLFLIIKAGAQLTHSSLIQDNISPQQVKDSLQQSLNNAVEQYKSMIKILPGSNRYPTSIDKNTGELITKDRTAWAAGFFPGLLWYLFEYTGDKFWKDNAIRWTENLKENCTNSSLGDIGYIMFSSYGNAFRIVRDNEYLSVIEKSANTLLTHYSENVECIHSNWWWGKWTYPVIIDYMMNLELLFWTANHTGNVEMKEKAIKHANKTIKNHFRKDFSTYHLVDYKNNGEVINRETFQGYSNSSTWARGQAWAIYGYTMAYGYTQEHEFLFQAECAANYFLNKLPDDFIPFWDFNAPGIPEEPKDASAAAIVASALIELAEYSENKEFYRGKAEKILLRLASDEYQYPRGEKASFILDHSTGYKKNGGFDQPLIYADYYYIEAITRYLSTSSTPVAASFINNNSDKFEIYPNPVRDVLYVKFSSFDSLEKVKIKIYSSAGTLLKSYHLNEAIRDFTIDFNALGFKGGVYFISLESTENGQKNKNFTQKVIYTK